MKLNYDVFIQIEVTKGLMYKFDRHKYKCFSPQYPKKDFYKFYQSRQSTNDQYLETFKNKVFMVDQYRGSIRTDPGLAKEELSSSDTDNQNATETSRAFMLAREKYLGIAIMCIADLA